MAAEEKTEEPTAKRKQDARNKGQIAKSRDLSAACVMLAAIYLLWYLGPYVGEYMLRFIEHTYLDDAANLIAPERKEIIPYMIKWGMWLALMTAPFMVLIAFFAYAVNCAQVGFLFTTEPLKIDFNKLNPVSGFKRIFSMRNVVMLAMNIAKLLVVLAVAWSYMYGEFMNSIAVVDMDTLGSLSYTTDRVLTLARNLAIILLVLGYADYRYQAWRQNEELKMTKQEIKEEFKQMEGDPKVKQKRRQKAQELAMNRMMQEVPQAEVVVRNPTHFAVAIAFNPEKGYPNPTVIAKGEDHLALRIIEKAEEAGVPLYQDPPLARLLYRDVDVGKEIPEELFATVAQILTAVMNRDKLLRYTKYIADKQAEAEAQSGAA